MARPTKKGLDYFPLDVDFANDPKIATVQRRHGIAGCWVLTRLYMEIYRFGYCYRWTKEDRETFIFQTRIEGDLVDEVIETCFNAEIFSRELFERESILTSRGIQKRYLNIKKTKAEDSIKPNYSLLLGVSRDKPGLTGINRDKPAQSKEKKSKVKESKEKERERARARELQIPEFDRLKILNNSCNGNLETYERHKHECELYLRANGWTGGNGRPVERDAAYLEQWIYRKDSFGRPSRASPGQKQKNKLTQTIETIASVTDE